MTDFKCRRALPRDGGVTLREFVESRKEWFVKVAIWKNWKYHECMELELGLYIRENMFLEGVSYYNADTMGIEWGFFWT